MCTEKMIFGILIFIIGMVIGSFLNVCIYRIPKEESISFPPSHCGSCGHNLGFFDLFPIISWVCLKGKCRYCKEKVSMQYPIVEALTGILFVLLYFKFGLSFYLGKYMFFTLMLIVIGIIDLKTQEVYDSTVWVLGVGGLIFTLVEYFLFKEINIILLALGVIIPGAIIAIFAFFNAMGWGDVEIIAVVGLFLGFKLNMVNLFISIVLGGVAAVIIMIKKGRERGATMAFGPYITLSSYITLLYGSEILNWYLSFIM